MILWQQASTGGDRHQQTNTSTYSSYLVTLHEDYTMSTSIHPILPLICCEQCKTRTNFSWYSSEFKMFPCFECMSVCLAIPRQIFCKESTTWYCTMSKSGKFSSSEYLLPCERSIPFHSVVVLALLWARALVLWVAMPRRTHHNHCNLVLSQNTL